MKKRFVPPKRNVSVTVRRRISAGIETLESRCLLASMSAMSSEPAGVDATRTGACDDTFTDVVSIERASNFDADFLERTPGRRAEGEVTQIASDSDTIGAPGTPIHTTIFDLASSLGQDSQPWQMTLDESAQTVWLTAESGMDDGEPKLARFDPATGDFLVYDLQLDADDNSFDNSHGAFFDFDSHLTPRVWVAHRARTSGTARISYLDIPSDSSDPSSGEIVSYELINLEGGIGDIPSLHAVFVDTRGTVWATSLNGQRILEIRVGEFLASGSINLDSRAAEIVVHDIPDGIRPAEGLRPHALEVAVDDQTGERFVWIVAGQGGGRTALLRPVVTTLLADTESNTGPNDVLRVSRPIEPGTPIKIRPGSDDSEEAVVVSVEQENGAFLLTLDKKLDAVYRIGDEVRGPDRWQSWDFTGLMIPAGGDCDDDSVVCLDDIRGTFTSIDDGETPGVPSDDRVVVTMPVKRQVREELTTGIIHVIDPRESILNSQLPASVDTYQIPSLLGQAETGHAAPNQPYVDRSGVAYFIDRLGSVGRFRPSDGDLTPDLSRNLPSVTASNFPLGPVPLEEEFASVESIGFDRTTLPSSVPTTSHDQSTSDGLDQYRLEGAIPTDPPSPDRGFGAFRGFLSDGNVLYGSLSQSDQLSVSVFAESSRRRMAAVPSPFGSAGITQARMAFQVFRDGSLILTARGDGVIGDDQENLLRLLDAAGRLDQDASDFAISGEASAMTLPDGTVHVMGRSSEAGVVIYSYTPAVGSTGWAHQDLFDPERWTVSRRTVGLENHVLAEDTVPIASFQYSGNSSDVFSATTAEGHWLAIPVSPSESVIDLTAESGMPDQGKVYSVVGTTQFEDTLFGYGTNQTGDVVQYSIPGDGTVSVKLLERPNEDTRLMRSVQAITIGDHRHLFGTDGVSRLVHWELSSSDFVAAENITNQTADSGRNAGYFQFQTGLTGRVLTDVAPVVVDGTIFVYGTNGKELVEFIKPSDGPWRVGNLTNDTLSTFGENTQSRVAANSVFGAPAVYVDTNGGRHVLQINVEGEVVEYFTYGNLLPGDEANRIHTQNVNFVTCLSPQRLMLNAEAIDDPCSVPPDPPQQTIWHVGDTVLSDDPETDSPELADENPVDETAVIDRPQNEPEVIGSDDTELESENVDVETSPVVPEPNPPIVPESSVEEETESELEPVVDLHPPLDSVDNTSDIASEVAPGTAVVPEVATPSRDVDGNGLVTAHDALLIINELTRMSDRAEGSVAAASRRHAYNLDVSGDQRVSLLDALLVINFLIEQKNGARAMGELAYAIDDQSVLWDEAIRSLVNDSLAGPV